jgi:hypothetical protein
MWYRILMSSPISFFIFLFVAGAATTLIKHLGRGTIPPRLEPVAFRWTNTGHDPKRFRLFLWLCFWLLAFIFFAVIGYYLYLAASHLGKHWASPLL